MNTPAKINISVGHFTNTIANESQKRLNRERPFGTKVRFLEREGNKN